MDPPSPAKLVPPPPGEQGCPVLAAQGRSADHILVVFRQNHADGHLPVIGAVGGIQGAGAAVEADFAGHRLLKL